MANSCINYLSIKGDKEDVARIKEALMGKDFNGEDTDFQPNNLVPRYSADGIHLDYDESGNYIGSPYDDEGNIIGTSRAKEWGSRYMEDAFIISDESTYITYQFESGWSPPIQWLEQVAPMYPTLEFELDYEEPGNGVYGRAKGVDGNVTDEDWTKEQYLIETHGEYPKLIEEVQGMSQEDLIRAFSSISSISDCYDETEEWPEFLDAEPYKWNNVDMYEFSDLTKHIIEAIEFKNLPLFISVDWDYHQDLFNSRLQQGE